MLWREVPYPRAHPSIAPLRFTATERGYRDRGELADLLYLSPAGLNDFQRSRGHGYYGPKWTTKAEGSVPVGVYPDQEVADWIFRRPALELNSLALHQHRSPSPAMRSEAEASIQSLINANRIRKK